MTDPHTIKNLNPSRYEAYDKLKAHSAHYHAFEEALDIAINAYFNYGPLSSITIAEEHTMWKKLVACPFLSGYERDILYCWYRREPERVKEGGKQQ